MDARWDDVEARIGAMIGEADALLRGRRVREAAALYDRAVAAGADPLRVGGERWMAAMLLGDLDAAWRISDGVLARTGREELNRLDRPFHRRAVWDGTPLDGRRVLVRCYHGLGDIVQFARYLPLVAERAAGLAVQAPEGVWPLLRGVPGVAAVPLVPLDDEAPCPPFDVDIELMELPHAFRTMLEGIPARVPYLEVDPGRVAALARGLPARRGRPRVGLAWAAGAWDGGHRSLPAGLAAALTALPGVDWVCLQRGPALKAAAGMRFVDEGPRSGDLLDTAAIMRSLDLVVSVDTLVAHLAGALAVPVWTLLNHEADWRWMVEREDSPWYPTMRLFRQAEPGGWAGVAARVMRALETVRPGTGAAGS